MWCYRRNVVAPKYHRRYHNQVGMADDGEDIEEN